MIPVTIGVTGHRDLRSEDIPTLTELVRAEIRKLTTKYTNSSFVMLSSLASGADQLCAEIAVELGLDLVCPLPMEIERLIKHASPEENDEFNRIAEKASEVFTVPFTEPEPTVLTDDYCYRQAGIYIAAHCHVMLALWDGTPPTPDGCGTAEAVAFMQDNNYIRANSSFFKATDDGAVLHIVTPRSNKPSPENAFSVRLIEKNEGALANLLTHTDLFNKESKSSSAKDSCDLIDNTVVENLNEKTGQLHEAYKKADSLSIQFRDKYLRAIKGLSVLGVISVLAFLLYDEMESNLFLIIYGAVLLLSFITWRFSARIDMHRKYLEYRALSETLRVQFFLQLRGINSNICDSYTWSQKNESIWVAKAVAVLLTGADLNAVAGMEAVKAAWIDAQLAYHKKAVVKDESSACSNAR